MKPLRLKMQAFGSYGKETLIDFETPEQAKLQSLMPLFLHCTEKPVHLQTKKKEWCFRVSMWNMNVNHLWN